MTILPGLVASGGALLFGVNAWCLDGRGLLWRENLPARPDAGLRRPGAGARRVPAASPPLITIALGRAARRRARAAGAHRAGGTLVVVVTAPGGRAPRMRWSLAAPLPGRPALGPGHPGPAGGDGRLLRPPRALDDVHRPVLLGCAHVPDWRLSLILFADPAASPGPRPALAPASLAGPRPPRPGGHAVAA